MAERKKFTVIISGGSIAGLSLANMLERAGIHFVLLEAYPDIAPQVGASIGLLPHGLRILDQLGVYGDIRKLVEPVDRFYFRNKDGKLLAGHQGAREALITRHGYPVLFLDRQMVLQVLYKNIRDKSKIMTNKRVCRLEDNEYGVTVTTADGSSYEGDIVVGADGIHSAVRQEMWRIADEVSPGYIPSSEKTALPCRYGCIFGISESAPGIKAGHQHNVFRNQSSYLVLGGLNDRVYWFYFFNIGKKTHAPNIPRYTRAEEAELIKKRQNDKILPTLRFGDIVKTRISSSMTPLEEYVFKKWHFGRIITIGDAAHKFEPISGHGGNAAIETAAALANGLAKSLGNADSMLTNSQIAAIFAEVQDLRQQRTEELVEHAHNQQRTEALENPLLKFTALYLLPLTDTDGVLFNLSKSVPQGLKLDMIDLPSRPKSIPFHDEFEKLPRPRGWRGVVASIYFLLLSITAYLTMRCSPSVEGTMDSIMETLNASIFSETNIPLKKTFTGINIIDTPLSILVIAFFPGIGGFDYGHRLLQCYFLISLFPLLAVWSIEACRKRNRMALVSLTSLWALVYQFMGIALLAPLYYLSYLGVSSKDAYWWPLTREVPSHYAKALLPALVIGYLIPTVLMFLPWQSTQTAQNLIAFWQPSPIYINVLLLILSSWYRYKKRPAGAEQEPLASKASEIDNPPDFPYLRRIYIVSFIVSTLVHLGTISAMLLSQNPQLSFRHVFIPEIFGPRPASLVAGLRNHWLADFWICVIASEVWCLCAVWDLKRIGRANTDMGKAAAAMILVSVIFGPGAAMVACWWWREQTMSRLSSRKKVARMAVGQQT